MYHTEPLTPAPFTGELPTVALDCSGECMPFNGKVTDGNLRPCCESSDVLVTKGTFKFAQCRRSSGTTAATWLDGNIVICSAPRLLLLPLQAALH